MDKKKEDKNKINVDELKIKNYICDVVKSGITFMSYKDSQLIPIIVTELLQKKIKTKFYSIYKLTYFIKKIGHIDKD